MSELQSATEQREKFLSSIERDERIEIRNHILNFFKSFAVKELITTEYEANIRDEVGLPSKLDIKFTTYGDNKLEEALTSILEVIYKMKQIGPTFKTVYENGEVSISLTYEFQNQVDTMKQLDT